jgi:two-component system, cell cycle response regulator
MAKKLLVADDSLTIQKVIKLALSNDGYEIQTVSDGNDAIQQISLFRPDVILIDVSLPSQTAFEVKAAINQHGDFENTKFILMSSAFEKVDEKLVQEVKFHGRLTKPFDPTHLRQVILEVLGQNEPAPTKPARLPPLPGMPDLPGNESHWGADEPSVDFPDLTPPPLPASSGGSATSRSAASLNLPPMPEFLSAPETDASDSDSDIKHLTESTVRLSGLDDFQWSINEAAKKPLSSAFEAPDHGLPLEPPSDHNDIEISSIGVDQPTLAERSPRPYSAGHTLPPPNTSSSPASSAEYDPSQVEEMIQRQVQKTLEETLEKMAQKILPEVAERVIKQEIRRLLQDPS